MEKVSSRPLTELTADYFVFMGVGIWHRSNKKSSELLVSPCSPKPQISGLCMLFRYFGKHAVSDSHLRGISPKFPCYVAWPFEMLFSSLVRLSGGTENFRGLLTMSSSMP